jgi:hypothetical protein
VSQFCESRGVQRWMGWFGALTGVAALAWVLQGFDLSRFRPLREAPTSGSFFWCRLSSLLSSSCAAAFDLVADTPWTPHHDFAVPKSLTQSLIVGSVMVASRD